MVLNKDINTGKFFFEFNLDSTDELTKEFLEESKKGVELIQNQEDKNLFKVQIKNQKFNRTDLDYWELFGNFEGFLRASIFHLKDELLKDHFRAKIDSLEKEFKESFGEEKFLELNKKHKGRQSKVYSSIIEEVLKIAESSGWKLVDGVAVTKDDFGYFEKISDSIENGIFVLILLS